MDDFYDYDGIVENLDEYEELIQEVEQDLKNEHKEKGEQE